MDTARESIALVEELAARYDLVTLATPVRSCRELAERSMLNVAVVGRFKAGKSSLLNFLIGQPLLPVGTLPVTTIVTCVRYGPAERVEVSYLDGRLTERSVAEGVADLVSERENPGNSRGIDTVTIELPGLERFRGLQLVDTPGLESTLAHNTETTRDWLPNATLAVLAVSADQPLSEHDVMLIKELRRYVPGVALVLTKVDLLGEPEREEMLEYLANRLRERGAANGVTLFPFSVKSGFEHLRESFQAELLAKAGASSPRLAEEAIGYKVERLLDEAAAYLSLARAAARNLDSERQALATRVLGERDQLAEIREELRWLARQHMGNTRPAIASRLGALRGAIEHEVGDLLEGQIRQWQRMNLWELSRAYEGWLAATIGDKLRAASADNREAFRGLLDAAQRTLSRAVVAFRDRLTARISDELGIVVPKGDVAFEVRPPEAPGVAIGRFSDFHWDLLWFLIPMRLFRPLVDRHMRRMIPYEVEKNLSRLTSQWADRLNDAIAQMERQADLRVDELLSTVGGMLAVSSQQAPEVERDLDRIAALRDRLQPGRSESGTLPPDR